MKYYLSLSFISLFVSALGQINSELSTFIDSLKIEDQMFRNLAREIKNNNPNDTIRLKEAYAEMRKVDSLVQIEVKQIYNKYGFPGEDRVGVVSCHNFWLLIQHCDSDPAFQEEVLESMLIEVNRENASGRDYAYLLDRVRVNSGEKQVYGTQMELSADSTSFIPKPLIEPEQLDERRKSMGLGEIKYYIETMNERYIGSLKRKE